VITAKVSYKEERPGLSERLLIPADFGRAFDTLSCRTAAKMRGLSAHM
jgi:hypothetical protein